MLSASGWCWQGRSSLAWVFSMSFSITFVDPLPAASAEGATAGNTLLWADKTTFVECIRFTALAQTSAGRCRVLQQEEKNVSGGCRGKGTGQHGDFQPPFADVMDRGKTRRRRSLLRSACSTSVSVGQPGLGFQTVECLRVRLRNDAIHLLLGLLLSCIERFPTVLRVLM